MFALNYFPPCTASFGQLSEGSQSFTRCVKSNWLKYYPARTRPTCSLAGISTSRSRTITLARGDLSVVTVPLSIFNAEGPCKPDFSRFELDDYGYSLRFGEYEASAHSVLYRIDPAYRRRAAQRRIAEERGFGPSLRRLRILRRLSRGDFPGISAKTIARIERGETEKPQGKTLERLSSVLGVAPTEIESY